MCDQTRVRMVVAAILIALVTDEMPAKAQDSITSSQFAVSAEIEDLRQTIRREKARVTALERFVAVLQPLSDEVASAQPPDIESISRQFQDAQNSAGTDAWALQSLEDRAVELFWLLLRPIQDVTRQLFDLRQSDFGLAQPDEASTIRQMSQVLMASFGRSETRLFDTKHPGNPTIRALASEARVAAMAQLFTPEAARATFAEYRDLVVKELGTARTDAESKIADARKQVEADEKRLAKLVETATRGQFDINENLLLVGLPILAGVVIAVFLITLMMGKEIQIMVIQNGTLIEVVTVFLLIFAVMFLGLANKLNTDAIGTLLGGIAGYVLGRAMNTGRTGNADGGPVGDRAGARVVNAGAAADGGGAVPAPPPGGSATAG